MRRNWRELFPPILIAATASAWASTAATALEHRDILGAWCSATAKIVFTRTAMNVTLFSTNRTTSEKISRFKFSGEDVEVFWIRDKKEVSALYSEFSRNNRVMVLQPDRNTPRREYRRC